MEQADASKLHPDLAIVVTLVQAVLRMESAPSATRGQVFRQVSKRMEEARAKYAPYPREPARRRFYRHCLREVARYRGGIAARAWYLVRWVRS